jgi:hypothetical protein
MVFFIFYVIYRILFNFKKIILQKITAYISGKWCFFKNFQKSVRNFLNLAGSPPLFYERTKKERKKNEKTNEKRTKSYKFLFKRIKIYILYIIYYIMPSYLCPRCGFKTSQRSNFKRHLTRKHVCDPINKDVTIESIVLSYGIDISTTEKNIVSQNVSQIKYQSHSISESQRITNCKYCNKSFTSANNCYRHQKHYCKYKKKEITITQDEIEKIKQEAEKKAKQKIKEAEEKIEVLADKKAQNMVLSLVDKLKPNQTTNNNNSHNTTNNITQNNQTNNNNNNNLKINNFGKEKTKYITDAKLKIMFVDPRNVVVQHIKDTYYHVLHPENFNAKITNCKSKHMHIYKDTDWEKVNKQLTICSMYNKHEKIIESEFERLKPQLTEKVRDNYNEYKKSTLHSFSTFKHRMVDIEAVIINGTKKHKQIDLLSEKEVERLAKEQGKTPGEIFAEHMPDIFGGEDDD